MVRAIVAIDGKRGLANDKGIPWLGKIPSDYTYYREKISGTDVIMGYGMYLEMKAPYPGVKNFVASNRDERLRDGFELVNNAYDFITNFEGDIWNMGGAGLFGSTLELNEELYITQLQGDFGCTKFFPEFISTFEMVSESESVTENGISFTFQVWQKKFSR